MATTPKQNKTKNRWWGRWEWAENPLVGSLLLVLNNDYLCFDNIALREEWPLPHEIAAKTPGVTPQDLKDLEEAREALLSEGLL